MTRDEVQAWLERYVEAWRSYSPDAVGSLFTDDATYAYHPYDDEPLRGRDAIVADWLGERDELGSWNARYEPQLIDGDRVVAAGETLYANGRTFSSLFVMRFDDTGRCASFVEWYMQHPA
jgi:ketosteroid isomerase-like protein